MSFAITYSRAQIGVEAPLISVEVLSSGGLPRINIVGLAETAVKEASDRVRGAIINSGLEFPSGRIIINLAPADLPKSSGRFDLAIALAILAAGGGLFQAEALKEYEFLGELSLTGEIRAVKGILPAVARNENSNRQLVVPLANQLEASVYGSHEILAANHLLEIIAHFTGKSRLPVVNHDEAAATTIKTGFRIVDVRGQRVPKRALTIAAAGQHNLLFIGPPGTGKSMLANRLPDLLPPMTLEEALELASIQSVSRRSFDISSFGQRPFRAPHHTASATALVGGGSIPVPGEISLAHHGVLFLDELPEFGRTVLESLREPLEAGQVIISRTRMQVAYPAAFQLIAAMNPCPCGYHGDPGRCECGPEAVRRYRGRISGPLMDRIDLHVDVPKLTPEQLANPAMKDPEKLHDELVTSVLLARKRMTQRRAKPNGRLTLHEVEKDCCLGHSERKLLEHAIEALGLSARAYFKILKVARTIADLDQASEIGRQHVEEAISYRRLDRYRGHA